MKNQTFTSAGFFVPIVFWLTLVISGVFNPTYNHSTDLVSSLGEIGTKTQYFFSVGLILCAILCVIFIIGISQVLRNLQQSAWPVVVLTTFPFSTLGAAVFPFPLRTHELFGLPVVLLPLSPLLALLMWRKGVLQYKFIGWIAFIFMMLGFTIYTKEFYGNYIGLKQRIFHLGWSLWFSYLALNFKMLAVRKSGTTNHVQR